jgi:hypothetical protein
MGNAIGSKGVNASGTCDTGDEDGGAVGDGGVAAVVLVQVLRGGECHRTWFAFPAGRINTLFY